MFMRGKKHLALSLFVLGLLVLPMTVVQAGEGGEGEGGATSGLQVGELKQPMGEMSRFLSSRSWLINSGLDPLLTPDLGPASAPPGSGNASPAQQAGGGALVPYRDPSAKFSRNILIPTDYSSSPYQTEPSIAVDPKDPDHILVGEIDYNFPTMVTYSSIDGGATWRGPTTAKYPKKDLASAGDPIVAFDRKGNAYYAFIALDLQDFSVGPIASSALVSAIAVATSPDGGDSWGDAVEASRSSVDTVATASTDGRPRGNISIGFLDKPWLAIGPNPKDTTKDILYIVYTKFTTTSSILYADELPFLSSPGLETVIEMVRSDDGGVTWSKPLEISPKAQYSILFRQEGEGGLSKEAEEELTPPSLGVETDLAATGTPAQTPGGQVVSGGELRQIVQGPDVIVAPDGSVYVAWMDSTNDDSFKGLAEIYVRRSDDGGVTFQPRKLVSTFPELSFQSRTAPFRSWAALFPKLAVGPEGNVYVAWVTLPTDRPEDDGDVYVSVSTNKGQTWSRRLRVNDDQGNGFQFFPEIVADPKGNIHMMWGDFRDDPKGVSYHIYYTESTDQGKTWSLNSRVSDYPTNAHRAFPGGRFIGDYFGIAATEGDVYMVWADGRLGEYGPLNQKIAFARKRLLPAPSVFISPPSGPAGKDIVIQGFNFQPDRNIYVEVAGVVVSSGHTQLDGRFTTQIFVPIAGRGAHAVRVLEESGNVASTSYYMDFGFDTIQQATDKVNDLSTQLTALQAADKTTKDALASDIRQMKEDLAALNANSGKDTPSGVILGLLAAALLVPIVGMGAIIVIMSRRRITIEPRDGPGGLPPSSGTPA